jgi:hypothetical protein
LAVASPSGDIRIVWGLYHSQIVAVSTLPSEWLTFICGVISPMGKTTSPPCLRFSRGCGL